MLFAEELRERVLSGDIRVTFRLWKRPKVRVGGRYRVGSGQIEVDAIEILPFSALSDVDVAASGESDRDALRARVAHAGPVADDTLVTRIDFHPV